MRLRLAVAAVFLALSTQARAQLDYSANAAMRSLPFGAAVAAELGYGRRVWGQEPLWYGYLRPYVRVQTSAVVNRGEVGLEINPISFFNITLAQTYTHRDTELDTLDCERLECRGGLGRSIAAARFIVGANGFFLSPGVRYEKFAPQNKDRNFGEEISNLEGQAGKDSLLEGLIFAGRKFDGGLSLGLFIDTAHMLEADRDNFTAMLFARQSFGPWGLTVSGGTYRSSTQATAFTAALKLSWTGAPAIGIF